MYQHRTPDFIGIGAQKAGTSWLFNSLNKLESFTLPPRKELHYFDRSNKYSSPKILFEDSFYKRAKSLKWDLKTTLHLVNLLSEKDIKKFKWYCNFYFSNYSDEWYLGLFKNFKGFTGEITPAYAMLTKEDIKQTHSLLGDVKYIFMVRNPIDRAWSSYKYKMRKKIKTKKYYKYDLANIISFINSREQLLRGDYLNTIENYTDVCGEGSLIIGFYDAILDKPESLLKEIVSFIGGNPEDVDTLGNLKSKVNATNMQEMPFEVREELKKIYMPQICQLKDTYGGYFSNWYNKMIGETIDSGYNATFVL